MSIQPTNDLVLIGDTPFQCESQPRRGSCLPVDSSEMQKILAEVARNKHTKSELLFVLLHFAKELESIKTDFGPELDTPFKELVTKFTDVTQKVTETPRVTFSKRDH